MPTAHNRQVTQQEYPLAAGVAIISRTDLKGHIVDCNEEFVQASGYEKDELIGKAHNIVRHPDMPSEAYRDMWETLKKGRPWSGIVKNRRKNGDHYWVRANATPLADGSGYMSVRVVPTRDEIRQAESLYARMRDNPRLRLREGVPQRHDAQAWLGKLLTPWQRSVTLRIMSTALGTLLVLIATAFYASTSTQESSVDGSRFHRIVQSKDLLADILPPPSYIIEAYLTTLEMEYQSGRDLQLSRDKLQQLRKDYDARHAYWEKADLPPGLREALLAQAHQPALQFFGLAGGSFYTALNQSDAKTANHELQQLKRLYTAHRQAIDQAVTQSNQWNDTLVQESRSYVRAFNGTLLLAVAVATLLGFAIATLTARSVRKPLQAAGKAADAIARGDLLCPLPPASQDEIGELVVQIAIMRNNLHEMAASIRQYVSRLNASAATLNDTTQGTVMVAHQQSESATSMAASIEQLSVSIDQVGEHAKEAHLISSTAGEQAITGGQTIHATADGMGSISQTVSEAAQAIAELEQVSGEVSSIVSTIKEIADQTNLLALNAAIEAARAGEQGRGFAVVADEVRKLAERTSTSTGSIAGMIQRIQQGTRRAAEEMRSSVEEVENGMEQARKAGESVIGIRNSAEQVVSAVDGIVSALSEQSAAARAIAVEVENIASGADINSQMMQNNAVSAEELRQLATALTQTASRFRITH